MKEVKWRAELPDCDLCKTEGKTNKAAYDAQIRGMRSWGYLCEDHFKQYGLGLGMGLGQRLIKE